jgi:predicted RecA/RadA family phage recombinase
MAEALMIQEGAALDYTPSSAVVAGKVIQMGGFIGVAKEPIAALMLGAIAIEGVFAFAKSGSAGPTFEPGEPVHFTIATGLASREGGSGTICVGICVKAALTGDTVVHAKLLPHGLPAFMQGKVWEDVTIAGGSKTLDAEDIGKVLNVTVGHATNVITLPATGAVYQNLCVRCGTTGQRVAISPAAADKIMGPNIAGVDDTDMIMAAATSQAGDYVALAHGGTDGWAVVARSGTFT